MQRTNDAAADLAANLKEMRQESVEGAEKAGVEMVAMPVEQLKAELEALAWMRQEVATRAADTKPLSRQASNRRSPHRSTATSPPARNVSDGKLPM